MINKDMLIAEYIVSIHLDDGLWTSFITIHTFRVVFPFKCLINPHIWLEKNLQHLGVQLLLNKLHLTRPGQHLNAAKKGCRHLKLHICQCAIKCSSCAWSLPHYIKNGGRHLKWEGYITLSVQRVCDIMGSFHVKARKIPRFWSIKHHVNIY